MDESTFARLFFITLLSVLPLIYCKDVCVKKTPCICEFPNGTYIDLTPSANNIAFISSTSFEPRSQGVATLNTFYYHPCHDIAMNIKDTNTWNTCDKPLALCRHVSSWNTTIADTLTQFSEIYEYLGSSKEVEFAEDGSYIKYIMRPSQVIVHLACAQSDDRLEAKNLSEPDSLELIFYSRNACLKPEYGNKLDIASWDMPLIQIACKTILRVINLDNSTTTERV
ncbi:uncharacterized protein LOC125235471 [Leguminivora glycinivorella]|uniref:uncharacterized protein LOC125235471 n=1 Tax=Leguminivora glycinivorella TaxID=1035111 RepID=UPI0020108A81|nr:uncharacterized protein LOC125235471 [Leguminivora glycinivorella]